MNVTQHADVGMRPQGVRRWRKRDGRCYELCFSALLDSPGWTLVHGFVRNEIGSPVEHAWLERDGIVYCVVLDRSFRAPPNWIATRRYSAVNAARAVVATGCYGPWTAEELPLEPS